MLEEKLAELERADNRRVKFAQSMAVAYIALAMALFIKNCATAQHYGKGELDTYMMVVEQQAAKK